LRFIKRARLGPPADVFGTRLNLGGPPVSQAASRFEADEATLDEALAPFASVEWKITVQISTEPV